MEIWLAALVVAVAYAVIAAVLAITGKQRVKRAVPPVPEQAKDSVKEDLEWAKTQAKSGRT
jgi:Putative Actinobacterial Holin-X, holin superfamily III